MIRLITPTEVINISYTNANTNEKGLVKDYIIEATQLRHIKDFVGNDLWDAMETNYEANSNTFTGDYLTLANKIKTPLAFFVKHELVHDSSINQTAKGLQVLNSEYSTPATDNQRGEIQKQALSHATALLEEVRRWIEKSDNLALYPDYTVGGNVTNNIATRGGIVI